QTRVRRPGGDGGRGARRADGRIGRDELRRGDRPVTDPRDVVAAKRDGRELEGEELRAFVLGYAKGAIPDYLAAAFLMAAYLNGLSDGETSELTRAMVDSGGTLPLAGGSRPKVDRH